MKDIIEISPYEYKGNILELIGKKWTLVSVKKDDVINGMTASWGGIGFLWNKPVAYIFIRPQRYTNTLLSSSTTFSLSFFCEEYRDMLRYMGRVSGKEENKIKQSGLHLIEDTLAPMYEEAEMTILCEKLYHQPLDPKGFENDALNDQYYPSCDHHILYIGEIKKIYQQNAK
ncbi:MAG: flavin reductase [Erysipelotrichaceae bacterium]|nr:flavin reductase [Erysipelotrichaceae bacterium]